MIKKKRLILAVAAVCIGCVGTRGLAAQTGLDGATILRKADAYREFSKSGFSFDFRVTESNGERSLMRVFLDSAGRDTSLVKYLEPRKYRRRVVLTVKNSFFVYDQGMMSPIRITPREMLFGQASAGDITRIAFSGMYSIESIAEGEGAYELRLKAMPDKGATYDLIDLTVASADCKPVRALCRASSGTLMKTITYDGFTAIGGRELLSSFTITDSANGDSCKVVLGNFSDATYPSSSFTVAAIKYVR